MSSFGQRSYTVEEATRRMEHYCAYQERCHREVVRKLRSMRMIPEAIDVILVHLIEGNYLNEERFAIAFARGKLRQKSWGRIRIRRELKSREISEYLIRTALDAITPQEYSAVFEEAAESRRESLRGKLPHEIRPKLYNYLYYRGWESERIHEFMRRAGLLD